MDEDEDEEVRAMADGKRVVVTGATGLIGKDVCNRLRAEGYEVVVFTREPERARRAAPGAADYVAWTPSESGPWAAHIDGAWGVVNLAGAPVAGKRWTEARKREIRDSRIVGTRGIVAAIAAAARKPEALVNASAIGYYGPRDDTPLDEAAPAGHDFLAGVVADWEAEARKAEDAGVRVALVRTGIVLDKDEGALAQLMLPYRFFVGGPVLPGTQWFSWIHHLDEAGIVLLALRDERARGPINATAPEPQTNRDFSRTLSRVMGRPSLFPVPGVALKLLFGEFAGTLTTGQRVLPARAQELGYKFQYPASEAALRQILAR
jgi:uncharacterized protein (TIGR01777 family)